MELASGQLVLLFVAFFLVSVIFMMFGQGGGAIYVPLLLAFGIHLYRAAATSQVLIMTATLSAILVFQRAKMIDWLLVLLIEPPTNLGAFLGGYLSPHFPTSFSKLTFAFILFIGAYFMIKPLKEKIVVRDVWYYWKRQIGEYIYSVNVLAILPIMFFAGFVAGMLGVGGGLFKVPALVLLGSVSMKIAVGSSSLMIGITALTGLIGHALVGHFDPKLAITLGIAVFLGAQIGARTGIKIEKEKHKKYFGYLLIFVAFWMIYSAFKG